MRHGLDLSAAFFLAFAATTSHVSFRLFFVFEFVLFAETCRTLCVPSNVCRWLLNDVPRSIYINNNYSYIKNYILY